MGEMRNVLGGNMKPPGCTNECEGIGACTTGQVCKTESGPDDANFYHYICAGA